MQPQLYGGIAQSRALWGVDGSLHKDGSCNTICRHQTGLKMKLRFDELSAKNWGILITSILVAWIVSIICQSMGMV